MSLTHETDSDEEEGPPVVSVSSHPHSEYLVAVQLYLQSERLALKTAGSPRTRSVARPLSWNALTRNTEWFLIPTVFT